MKDVFGYNTRMLSREQLHEEFVGDQEAAGALLEPDGIGVHPLKLAFGYLKERVLPARKYIPQVLY